MPERWLAVGRSGRGPDATRIGHDIVGHTNNGLRAFDKGEALTAFPPCRLPRNDNQVSQIVDCGSAFSTQPSNSEPCISSTTRKRKKQPETMDGRHNARLGNLYFCERL